MSIIQTLVNSSHPPELPYYETPDTARIHEMLISAKRSGQSSSSASERSTWFHISHLIGSSEFATHTQQDHKHQICSSSLAGQRAEEITPVSSRCPPPPHHYHVWVSGQKTLLFDKFQQKLYQFFSRPLNSGWGVRNFEREWDAN